MTPGLVIFDCDGVLVDSERLGNQRLAQVLTEAGFPISYEDCRRTFVGKPMAAVQAHVEATGVMLGADFVQRWNDGLPDVFRNGLDPIPHVGEAVAAIAAAGLPFCVASSGQLTKMRLTLGLTGLLSYFEQSLFSVSMVSRGKPFPDLFLHAAQAMGHTPEACVVVEDSVAGVTAARAAGMRALAYAGDPEAEREGLAAAGGELFDDMRDLPRLIGL
ncbi:HAD family hydrolase [Mesorhizobium australicum]|uniref:Haloacid dehalogenase superfamily, subfamily IA, variant 3 with third motif having DD or ED n=1 Tax=Mesorhizobium australicum TaxID=536018 RepID=A0A1X7NA41_9HYPH|nr:HAD-IA family hydrolase [Mesorhizobium australicum]SMH34419.1 haloacid dehalogenase superfamily, subfamily IA, variant 3 with third motif having DD or ED [Mesorhizobium australicum]